VGIKPVFTLKKEVSRKGVGLFTGEEAILTLQPLPEKSGIWWQREDLPSQPKFRMHSSCVQGTPRCTVIGKEGCSIQTVEHLMAAFHACSLTDVLIRLHGSEVPIFDGSSLGFLEMIDEAGMVSRGETRVLALAHPIFWSQGDTHLVALPSTEFRLTYTLHYPSSPCIGTQFYSLVMDRESFTREIAPSRTFSVYEEVLPLIEKGLLRGGSLDNAVVIREERVMNPGGLRFSDEMVRHKILDLIGDLYLTGYFFSAHILAVRSGHYANNALAKELVQHFTRGEEDDSR